MLDAQAIPVLIGLLGHHSRAADLLFVLAKEQQCKDAFLESTALEALLSHMQSGQSPFLIIGSFDH